MSVSVLRPALLALASLPILGGTADAGVIAADPAGVVAAMQEFGYTATLETDSLGDPKISSRVSQSNFVVLFFGCTDNVDCASIQFYVGYDLTDSFSALKANEWNRTQLFTKATIDDEGDPALEMDVNLDFDGSGADNFQDVLDIWRISVEQFEDFIDF